GVLIYDAVDEHGREKSHCSDRNSCPGRRVARWKRLLAGLLNDVDAVLFGQCDEKASTWLAIHCAASMPLADGILHEQDVAAPKLPPLSGGHLYLDVAIQQHDQLATWRAAPIVPTSGLILAKDDRSRRHLPRKTGDGPTILKRDVETLKVRIAVGIGVDACDLHYLEYGFT